MASTDNALRLELFQRFLKNLAVSFDMDAIEFRPKRDAGIIFNEASDAALLRQMPQSTDDLLRIDFVTRALPYKDAGGVARIQRGFEKGQKSREIVDYRGNQKEAAGVLRHGMTHPEIMEWLLVCQRKMGRKQD